MCVAMSAWAGNGAMLAYDTFKNIFAKEVLIQAGAACGYASSGAVSFYYSEHSKELSQKLQEFLETLQTKRTNFTDFLNLIDGLCEGIDETTELGLHKANALQSAFAGLQSFS